MEYSELVKSIATSVLEECGVTEAVITVGRDTYKMDSIKDDDKKAIDKFKTAAADQNRKIDNETEEEKANRKAQFKKAHGV